MFLFFLAICQSQEKEKSIPKAHDAKEFWFPFFRVPVGFCLGILGAMQKIRNNLFSHMAVVFKTALVVW